jgi:2-iminoacetate synthase
MSFVDVFKKMSWDDSRLSIYSKTQFDVEQALGKSKLDLEDFKALISPAAESYLEVMAQKSMSITKQRFGNTVGLYVPLYLSNLCSNVCTYCGFSMENRVKRKTLNLTEISDELDVLKKMSFDNILLVTGEHESKVGMRYFEQVIPFIKERFNYVAIEVQPLHSNEYNTLSNLGLDAVMIYQETYNPSTYAQHHLRGNKSDFENRLEAPDRIAQSGVDKIGLGALIGLDDWRTDSFFVASHLDYLEKKYWKTRYSISFPRIRPCEGGFQPKSIMTDRQLVQLICAYRLFNHHIDLSLSTRETPTFRDKVLPLGITTISAASKTQPGGYANSEEELEQFEISDERGVNEISMMLKKKGFTAVWKDWDKAYSA